VEVDRVWKGKGMRKGWEGVLRAMFRNDGVNGVREEFYVTMNY
jgi:hypothetical protein